MSDLLLEVEQVFFAVRITKLNERVLYFNDIFAYVQLDFSELVGVQEVCKEEIVESECGPMLRVLVVYEVDALLVGPDLGD